MLPKWVEEVRCIEAGVGRVTPSPPAADGCAPLSVQVGAGDLDGFQADTEEEEEEGDCVIMDISDVGGEKGPKPSFPLSWQEREERVLLLPHLPLVTNED